MRSASRRKQAEELGQVCLGWMQAMCGGLGGWWGGKLGDGGGQQGRGPMDANWSALHTPFEFVWGWVFARLAITAEMMGLVVTWALAFTKFRVAHDVS